MRLMVNFEFKQNPRRGWLQFACLAIFSPSISLSFLCFLCLNLHIIWISFSFCATRTRNNNVSEEKNGRVGELSSEKAAFPNNLDATFTFYKKKSRNKASEWTHPKRRVAVVVGPQAWPARAPSTKQSLIDQLGPTATLPPVLPSICSSTSQVLSTS